MLVKEEKPMGLWAYFTIIVSLQMVCNDWRFVVFNCRHLADKIYHPILEILINIFKRPQRYRMTIFDDMINPVYNFPITWMNL